MKRIALAGSVVAALGVGPGCHIAKPPAEPPTRIMALDRDLPVVAVSKPPGLVVYRGGAGGVPQEIGPTPVVVDRVHVTKELWKHGAPPPPPSGASFELDRSSNGVERQMGEEMRWTLLFRDSSGAFREVTFRLDPAGLAEAFSRGRLELSLPEGALSP